MDRAAPWKAVPAWRAWTAPVKESPVNRWTYSMTSPPAPHPKQWNRSGTPPTDRDGVGSSWKGQQPMKPRPRWVSSTPLAATTSSIRWPCRTAATSRRGRPVTVMAGSRRLCWRRRCWVGVAHTWLVALRGRGRLVLYRLPVAEYTNRSGRSGVGEAFVDDPLLAVGGVGLDEGLPRALIGAPG